ncbi:methyltransferase domain-containing protein [Brevibacillus centrosporus]|uniref:class I SAM-dependent methyltransferase n=1 Tax=Brevibacillus centrosporus TaxID=54910 RepID=UPI002E215660|nr:methyltransferase domain-containing protein [Brevibacillus centrosporus]MED4912159.1 methyltransferase domain-containing protein [Brevibacillus centrosporus]
MDPYISTKTTVFDMPGYLEITQARLAHLASMNLHLSGKSIIDVGCGTGRLTEFLLNQGANVFAIDGREDNIQQLRMFYPNVRADVVDLETDELLKYGLFDIVFCYGILYHLSDPLHFIKNAEKLCRDMILIETCITDALEPICKIEVEDGTNNSQSIHHAGSRPSPAYVIFCLKKAGFPFIYAPKEKPAHPQFHYTTQNNYASHQNGHLIREIIIASKNPVNSDQLVVVR